MSALAPAQASAVVSMQRTASTLEIERARLAGALVAIRDQAGYRGAKAALDAEWARLVARDPTRALSEGFVG